MKIQLIISAFLALLLGGCGYGESKRSSSGQEEVIAINATPQEEKSSEYTVRWGSAEIPLTKYANPEVYQGSVEVTLTEFWDLLGMPIVLDKRGKKLEYELASMHREPRRRYDSLWVAYPEVENGQLDTTVISRFRKGVQQGEVIALRLFSTSDDAIVQSAYIVIKDPNEPYIPEVQLEYPRYQPDVFGFQVIQEPGRRPVLRIDTTSASTRAVYELYRDNLLYKIIHIPGFQTHRRLLSGDQQLFNTKDIRKSVVLGKEILDWMQLPEYIGYNPRNIKLQWGEMVAQPSGGNFMLSVFKNSHNKPLELSVDGKALTIRSFRLIVNSETNFPQAIVSDQLDSPAIQKLLSQVLHSSSVYFTQLIVDDGEGQCALLPQDFAFHIGRQ